MIPEETTRLRKFVDKEFPVFARNLEFYQPHLKGVFMCPPCLNGFDNVDEQWVQLSRAHITPEFQGGKDVTLVCRACNSFVGGQIEGQEKKRIVEYEQLFGSNASGKKVQLTFSTQDSGVVSLNAYVSTELSERGRGLIMCMEEKRADPKSFRESLSLFKAASTGSQAAVRIGVHYKNSFDDRVASLAAFSVAYLRLFHELGYEWVMTPVAASISTQLLIPNLDLIRPHTFELNGLGEFPSLLVALEPAEHKGFFIPLPQTVADPEGSAVWIPAFHNTYPSVTPPDLKGAKLSQLVQKSLHDRLTDRNYIAYWHGLFYPGQTFDIDWGQQPTS